MWLRKIFGCFYWFALKLQFSHQKCWKYKVARSKGILSKLKHFLHSTSLLKLYYAFIHPHLLYGLSIWGSTHKSYLSKVQLLQYKAVKIIGGGKYMDHATPFYSKLKILKIPESYKPEVAKLVFHHYHQRLPPLLSNPRMAVQYGTLVRYSTPQFLLRSTVHWCGTLFL